MFAIVDKIKKSKRIIYLFASRKQNKENREKLNPAYRINFYDHGA
jgi:hypothetical protein